MTCDTAIFYDIENLTGVFNLKTNTVINLEEIHTRVLALDMVRGISVQRAYADWGLPLFRGLRHSVLQSGIEPIQIFSTNQYDRLKNAADVSLIIDAVELIAKRPDIQNFCIASGDGIFAYLSKKLHEYGKYVIAIGFEHTTGAIFRNACDKFMLLDKHDTSLSSTKALLQRANNLIQKTSKRFITTSPKKIVPPPPPPVVTSKPELPVLFPKTKISEAMLNANIEIKTGSDISTAINTVRSVVETIFNKEPDEIQSMEISMIMTYLNHFMPNFNVKILGFPRFSDFMVLTLSASPFCVWATPENIMSIARREKAPEQILPDVYKLIVKTSDGNRYASFFDIPLGSEFTYTFEPSKKQKPILDIKQEEHLTVEEPKHTDLTKEEPIEPIDPMVEVEKAIQSAGSVRKWIKDMFIELSKYDALTEDDILALTEVEGSRELFRVKTPILKLYDKDNSLDDQRTINGIEKYWKELFVYKSKEYLVYKGWVASKHKQIFTNWLKVIADRQNV